MPASGLVEVAAAFADIPDLKSPYLHGHSSGVARMAGEAAGRLGLDEVDTNRIAAAAFLHDLGRVGISDGVWDRPARSAAPQWEQVRLHAYHSERVLARSRALEPIARSPAATTSGSTAAATTGVEGSRAARSRPASWPSPTRTRR